MKNFLINEGYEKNFFLYGGKGSKVFSKNKIYEDLSFGAGSLILGHNNIIQKKCFDKFKNKTTLLTYPNIQAVKFSRLLARIFKKYPKFVLCSTGSEAITKSLRIVKAITNKKIIVAVTGSWHGSAEKLLFNSFNGKNYPISDGLDDYNLNNLKFIEYNNFEKTEKTLNTYKKKISCIIIEPIQGCLPDYKFIKYIKYLFNYAKKNKILIIFDEMITGLRVNGNSVQEYLKILPDISIFGKSFGGGLPIGVIALSKKMLIKIKKKKLNIFYGGTYSANSFSTLLAYETTKYIVKNKKIINDLNKKSKYFQITINNFLQQQKIPAKIFRFQSLLRLVFSDKIINNRAQRDYFETKNVNKINKFKAFLKRRNILYPKNGLIFFSAKTSIKNLNFIIKNFQSGLKYIYK
jgi:glutamate-1-semialdehyde aminotransferase